MKKSTKKKIMAIFIALAFTASIATTAITFILPSQNNQQSDTWAARISVVIFGEVHYIPAGLGITDNVAGPIYTLDSSNIIYKNTTGDVSLKEVFEQWGENFNSTCIMDYCNTNTSSMMMYVNGVANTDYELYTIQNQDDIIIDYR